MQHFLRSRPEFLQMSGFAFASLATTSFGANAQAAKPRTRTQEEKWTRCVRLQILK
jgi:hypothetical protein